VFKFLGYEVVHSKFEINDKNYLKIFDLIRKYCWINITKLFINFVCWIEYQINNICACILFECTHL